ncbi:hypothetical protein PAXRUDRAFT_167378, partial [Paxillus rubicundulus Ve08.2h10]
WTAFALKPLDWECVNDMKVIISDANDIQQYFSDEEQPTLWHAIPAFEELQTAWEGKQDNPKYLLFKNTLCNGLDKISKYYNWFDEKPVYILALGKCLSLSYMSEYSLLCSTTPLLQTQLH